MSLVGPRPEVEQFVKAFPVEYVEILTVKPGITHQGTLIFRNEEELLAGAADPVRLYLEDIMPRKLAIYREYLQQSVLDEIRIVLATVFPRRVGDRTFRTGRLEVPTIVAMVPPTTSGQVVPRAENSAMEEMA
jgi:lipopolysaccharide/colanic/teichoic acid biosynthesis glycosyltransferase